MRHIVLPLLRLRHRLDARGTEIFRHLMPPYIVVANHQNFWDPFWISSFMSTPVQFVTSDNIFRTFWFGLAMRLFGSVPKAKLMTDTRAVRQVVGVLRSGGVIGIFPEGARTYDGRSQEPIETVARLLRMLRLPVVGVRIRGGYLQKPRWARASRRGPVTLEYGILFTGADLTRMSTAEVLERMSASIAVDEMQWQARACVPFRGPRPAEYLERLLFVCPSCRSISSLVSRGSKLMCTACGAAVTVDEYGSFRASRGPLYFRDPAAWNAWQLPVFRNHLATALASDRALFSESPASLLTGHRLRRLRQLAGGTALLFPDRIVFRAKGLAELALPLRELRGMNVQNREKLEFYWDGALYRLDFANPRASPYKWTTAVGMLTELADATAY
ncbi:MAG TPA: lysophospholipid acyltransferase family protein, partial [Spirochaetia bacterium]